MPTWKKNIFVRVIKDRMLLESRAAQDIIEEYINLTQSEQTAILLEF